MGEVFRGWDPRLEREVAIKILPAHLTEDPAALARFESEAKVIASLSHPNVLAIYDFGVERGIPYIVTELLVGETLRARIAREPLEWRKASQIAAAVADGLSATHSKGIIHRDLKPENLFLTPEDRVKILDFGLARLVPLGDRNETSFETRSSVGSFVGTVGYMSPEQVRGVATEASGDIFSLGCVIYEMISGRRAFTGASGPDTLVAVLTASPPQLSTLAAVPAGLDRLIARCLDKEPAQRYQSAKELAADLAALSSGSGVLRDAHARRKAIDSVAVMPLENVSGNPETEYFADGVTESIINNLSQLPKLRVIARSTVFRYKGKEWDADRVGRALSARTLLTGRIVQRGDNLNIQVELVQASDGAQLWGERYSRPMADIIELQAEIAGEISAKLRLKLTGEEKKRLAKRHTIDPEAYRLYWKGRFFWNKRVPDAIMKSIPFFEQAIERDPGYALAFSGLADSYALLSTNGLTDPLVVFPRAKAAAQRALQLDDRLAEAHVSLALVKIYFDWDWEAVEHEADRANKLNPNYPTLHHWISIYWCARSRFDKALEQIRFAQELDPLSLIINTHYGWVYYFARRFDEAIQQYKRALEMEPNFAMARYLTGGAFLQLREYDAAISSIQQAIELTKRGSTEMIAALGHAFGIAGRREEAQAILAELMATSQQRYVSPFDLATVHVGLGDADQSFEWLEKAYQGRSHWMVGLAVDPRLDPIRSDGRFEGFLSRLKLVP
jgi:serine/threonine-protein kinase